MNQSLYYTYLQSPVGILKLKATDDALVAIEFYDGGSNAGPDTPQSSILDKALEQLTEYFEGRRKSFDLSIAPPGTDFEREVWKQLKSVRYGTTVTYSEIAQKLGDVNKVRAVGRANGQNPLPIVIPCHRVIGANNKLTGYAGGIERKRWLLQHEGVLLL